MTIETKFKPDDRVFFMYENRVRETRVTHISIAVDNDGISILMTVENPDNTNKNFSGMGEHKFFATKEELLNSL